MDFEGNLLRSDFFEVILSAGIFIAVILSLSQEDMVEKILVNEVLASLV